MPITLQFTGQVKDLGGGFLVRQGPGDAEFIPLPEKRPTKVSPLRNS